MIREQEVQELVEFRSNGAPVLSIYLNLDPTRRSTEQYKLALRNLLATADLADAADAARVERYVGFEYNWQGRGLACFSCQRVGFWRAYPLLVPVQDQVYVGDRPYVKPLSDLMDNYSRYGVVLVDQEGARLFIYNLGQLEEATGTLGLEIKRHKRGGSSAARYQSRADEHANQNLKSAAELATRFYTEGRCRRLLVGGQDETVARFQEYLPKALRERVVGTFSIGMNASPAEVKERTLEMAQRVEEQEDAALVEQIVTTAAKGGAAVTGLGDTLASLQEERMHKLVIAEGFHAPAYRCERCRHIVVEPLNACPLCGSKMHLIADAVDSLVRRAIERGAEVNFVRDNEALVRAGSIGALLRY
ncbi:MAG: hypothetical protein IT330_03825 [Anaerolineae bacterium]|nr:hypothetical protein [Anaerolineae bacterium]